MPDQGRPARGDLQGMIPPVMLHGEERSKPGNVRVYGNRESPRTGPSSLTISKDGRFAAVLAIPAPSADRHAPVWCARHPACHGMKSKFTATGRLPSRSVDHQR
jgi:hypothetical protein